MKSTCDSCGNVYAKPLKIVYENETYHFDSFECAIHKLAPHCAACEMRIIGHGVQVEDEIYCCGHCAREKGHVGIRDHSATESGEARPH